MHEAFVLHWTSSDPSVIFYVIYFTARDDISIVAATHDNTESQLFTPAYQKIMQPHECTWQSLVNEFVAK